MSCAADHRAAHATVREYLAYHGFHDTADTLEGECLEKSWTEVKLNSRSKLSKEEIKQTLCRYMEEGSFQEFNDLWGSAVPEKIRNSDPTSLKVEFYANLYIAIYPVHELSKGKKIESLSTTKSRFKSFLENKGDLLSKIPEFIQFYALPFVPNPMDHPSFKEIFTVHWVRELRERLERFVDITVTSEAPPRIYLMCSTLKEKPLSTDGDRVGPLKTRSRSNSNESDLQLKLMSSEQRELKLREMLLSHQETNKQLREFCVQLLETLESCSKGEKVLPDYIRERTETFKKIGSQPNQPKFTANILSQSPALSDVNKSKRNSLQLNSYGLARPSHHNLFSNQTLAPLDYLKIKEHLSKADAKSKAYLLQALRWRITKSPTGDSRKRVVQSYINSNLFSLSSNTDLLNTLLFDESPAVKQEATRLLNIISSDYSGRDYLKKRSPVKDLVRLINSEPDDTVVRQNCIGTLQKLSLNRAFQSEMIEAGLIEAILVILRGPNYLSDYSLEYSSALLMNLCLRHTGRTKCEALDIFSVLSQLLETKDPQIREYIHGALYSILKRPVIREKAKSFHLETYLQKETESSTPTIRKQIDFVIKQLNSDDADDSASIDGEEEEDTNDDEEEFTDHDESYEGLPAKDVIQGEKLLCSSYLIHNEAATSQIEEVEKAMRLREKQKHDRGVNRNATSDADSQEQDRSDGKFNQDDSQSSTPRHVGIMHHKKGDIARAGINKAPINTVEYPEYEAAFGTRPRLARTPLKGERRSNLRDSENSEPTPSSSLLLSQNTQSVARDKWPNNPYDTQQDDTTILKSSRSSHPKPPSYRRASIEKKPD